MEFSESTTWKFSKTLRLGLCSPSLFGSHTRKRFTFKPAKVNFFVLFLLPFPQLLHFPQVLHRSRRASSPFLMFFRCDERHNPGSLLYRLQVRFWNVFLRPLTVLSVLNLTIPAAERLGAASVYFSLDVENYGTLWLIAFLLVMMSATCDGGLVIHPLSFPQDVLALTPENAVSSGTGTSYLYIPCRNVLSFNFIWNAVDFFWQIPSTGRVLLKITNSRLSPVPFQLRIPRTSLTFIRFVTVPLRKSNVSPCNGLLECPVEAFGTRDSRNSSLLPSKK